MHIEFFHQVFSSMHLNMLVLGFWQCHHVLVIPSSVQCSNYFHVFGLLFLVSQ